MKIILVQFITFLVAINIMLSCGENQQTEPDTQGSRDSTTSSAPEPNSTSDEDDSETVNKKFDGLLLNVVAGTDKGSISPNDKLDSRLLLKEGRIAVELTYANKQVTPESIRHFKQLGGLVDSVFSNKLYGWIPAANVRTAATPKAVWMITAATQVAYPINNEKSSGNGNDPRDSTTADTKPDPDAKEEENVHP